MELFSRKATRSWMERYIIGLTVQIDQLEYPVRLKARKAKQIIVCDDFWTTFEVVSVKRGSAKICTFFSKWSTEKQLEILDFHA